MLNLDQCGGRTHPSTPLKRGIAQPAASFNLTVSPRYTNKIRGHADAYRHLTGKVKYMLSYELSVKWMTFLMGC
jgi:hypothetical protein